MALQAQRPLSSPAIPHGQGCVAFLPFTRVSLKSLIPKECDFEPQTLGDHVRKKRLKMGLMQKEAAELLGVNTWTVLNWEKGHTDPPIVVIPAILSFLGYDPFPKPKKLAQRLLAKRREMGWSIKQAANVVGVDPDTWRKWEGGKTILYRKHRARIAQLLGQSPDLLNNEMASQWNGSHKRASKKPIRGGPV